MVTDPAKDEFIEDRCCERLLTHRQMKVGALPMRTGWKNVPTEEAVTSEQSWTFFDSEVVASRW